MRPYIQFPYRADKDRTGIGPLNQNRHRIKTEAKSGTARRVVAPYRRYPPHTVIAGG